MLDFVPRCSIDGVQKDSVSLDAETIGDQDVVVVLTPHADVDVHALVNAAAMVFDSRGVTVCIYAPNVLRL